jgi:Xaa-Pro aminopeptidase
MHYKRRQNKLRERVGAAHFDALLVSHLPNIHYLCGFTGSAGLLLVEARGSIFFSDFRYDAQAHEEVKGAKIVIGSKSPLESLGQHLSRKRKASRSWTIGIEAEHLTVAEKNRLTRFVPSDIRIKDAPAMVEPLRLIKDGGELARIREAANLGANLFDRALEVLRAGVTEVEVATEMELMARRAGADGMSFPTIIAAGQRSALPHGRASVNPIPSGGFVVCDFGVILAGYCSDQTRTVWVGPVSKEARRIYDAVREAQQAAVEAVRPGVTAGDVDAAARNVLQKAGLARYFTHSTGHGVGLEIHEAPRIAAGQKDVLQPGMVITIEPGVYFAGKWGVRIEDMVAVTPAGREVLTPTSKNFIAV